MREHHSNESYNSRYTRWVDRLLPLNFEVKHLPGTRMALVDYTSHAPNLIAPNVIQYDKQLNVGKLDVNKVTAKRCLLQ